MCLFVESLRIENGKIPFLHYHNERFNRTRREVFGVKEEVDLADVLTIPEELSLIKCRVEYNPEIIKIEYLPYQMRPVHTLQLVTCNEIDYHYKSTDRTLLNQLYAQRGSCDDILIVRNGLLTDASASNVALFDGEKWYTPANPLLPGTHRAYLLDRQLIFPRDIAVNELSSYQTICLFNAMIDFGQVELPINKIGM